MTSKSSDFKIIIDHREKRPFFIDKAGCKDFPDLQIEWNHLATGDYSIQGMHSPECDYSIAVERKSLPDLFMSVGRNRERLIAEFERMAMFDFAALVIEGDFYSIFKKPPPESAMSPKAVFRSLLAFSQRYNLHIYPCPNRQFAEKTTYLILQRFWNDKNNSGKRKEN